MQGREQPAGDRGERAREQEDRNQQALLGDAGRFSRYLGVAHRDQGTAESAMGDIGGDPGRHGREAEAEIIEAGGTAERIGKFRAGDADAATGHALPGQCDLGDDGRKAERRHREIEGAQPQRRQSDDHAEDGADDGRDRKRGEDRQCRQHIAGDEHARGVGAERQQRDIADRKMTGETDHKVETGDQHPIDRGAGADQNPVIIADEGQDDCEREDNQKRHELHQ